MKFEDYDHDDFEGEDDDGCDPCPECGADVYADAPQCAACGYWIGADGDGVQTWTPKRGLFFKTMVWLLIFSFSLIFLASLVSIFK